jgi:hypothetical protein
MFQCFVTIKYIFPDSPDFIWYDLGQPTLESLRDYYDLFIAQSSVREMP